MLKSKVSVTRLEIPVPEGTKRVDVCVAQKHYEIYITETARKHLLRLILELEYEK